jgi:CubicO group peptidase (beta-lactamase class C family)
VRKLLLESRAVIALLVLGCGVAVGAPVSAPAAMAGDWRTTTAAEAGFKSDVAKQLDDAVQQGKLKNLHAVVVVRGGKLVFERYYEGDDQLWAMPIGKVKFGPNVKHDLRSASKSVVSLLYGIALQEGKVPAPSQPLLAQFPALKDLAADPKRQRMRIEHALSMTLGMDWPEDIPYTDSRNPELAMYLATDTYRYIFDRAVVTEPGSKWNYNGGATAILGHLIAQGTGQPLFNYAREKLFKPLGITEVQWVGGTNGEVSAASGLRMVPRDFAKIGQLVLNNGRWGDKQVVPAEWLKVAHTPHATVQPAHGDEPKIEYGYQWWLVNHGSEQPWTVARGNGGQTVFVVPSLNLVVATMAGNYNAPGAAETSMAVMTGIVLPALKAQ